MAIEENISSINPPLRRPFEEFITQMKFTGSNEKAVMLRTADVIQASMIKKCGGGADCYFLMLKKIWQPILIGTHLSIQE